MTTQTLTLTEFLLARYAEDEAVARAATPGPWKSTRLYPPPPDLPGYLVVANDWLMDVVRLDWDSPNYRDAAGDCEHIARHDPARVLADVEAKRRIVEVAMPGERDDAGERGRILRILASVHADHPDYREEWRA